MRAALPGRQELFIYYRVREAHEHTLAAAVGRMQAGLCVTHAGLAARLMRRPDGRDGLHTWMEAYGLPPNPDVAAIAADIERAAQVLAPWIAGPRHAEHFIACAS
ncbi:DUF4936 family protein [Methylibium sp.]|uniref:DUF4936 family protein n=1 Tax=Methylibium sp. TaxID=2067992 RepID=UPI003D148317